MNQKMQTRRERYLRDPFPVRLGNLASNLARMKSFTQTSELGEAAERILRESKFFIEWAGPDAPLNVEVELIELQRLLAGWQLRRLAIWGNADDRAEVAQQANDWSEKILHRSGLLAVSEV